MSYAIRAVYEKGLLRPLEPVELAEGERVTVSVSRCAAPPSAESAHAILEAVAALAVVREGDRFSGEDHDAALYGAGAAR